MLWVYKPRKFRRRAARQLQAVPFIQSVTRLNVLTPASYAWG
jgi:hypothetical protein